MKYLVLFFGLLFCFFESVAQTFENSYDKTIKYYRAGNYEKALATLEKEFKKNEKAGLKTAQTWYWIQKAKILEAQKNYQLLQEVLTKVKLEPTEDFSYATSVLHLSELFLQMGQYKKSFTLLESVPSIFQKDSLWYYQKEAILAQNKLRIGKLNELEEQLNWLIPAIERTLNKNINYIGNAKKVSNDDIAYREELYASLWSIKMQLLAEKGDYLLADSLLRGQKDKIKKITGKKSPEMAQHLFYIAENYENMGESSKALPFLKEIVQNLSATHTLSLEARLKILQIQKEKVKKEKVEINEDAENENDTLENINNITAIDTLLENSATKKKKDKIANGFQKVMQKYYPVQHYYWLKKDFFEAENLYKQNKLDKAKNIFEKIYLTSDTLLPKNTPLAVANAEYLTYFHDFKTAQDIGLANAEFKQIYEIYLQNFGEEALPTILARIRWGDFQLLHTADLPALKTYYGEKKYTAFARQWLPSHKNYIETNNILQKYFDITESYEEAYKYLTLSEEEILKRYGEKSSFFGENLLRKANIFLKKHNYSEAETNVEKAAVLLRKKYGKRSVQYANAIALKARIYAKMGLYEESEDLLRQAGRIYQRKSQKALEEATKSSEDLAQIYMLKADFRKAENLLNKLLTDYKERYGANTPKLITPLNLLAKLYLTQGKYEQVEAQMRVAEVITEKVYGKNTLIYADYLEQATDFHQSIFNVEKAETTALQMLKIQQEILGKESVAIIPTLTNLANLQFQLKKKSTAEVIKMLEQAKQIALEKLGKEHQLYAETLKNLAIIYADTDSLATADKLLDEAAQIWTKKTGKRNLEKAEIELLRGDIALKMKNLEKAELFYTQANETFKKIFDKKHPTFVKSQSKMARLAFVKKDYLEANRIILDNMNKYKNFIQNFFPALSEQEKERYWQEIQGDFEFFHTLVIQQAEQKPELLGELYNNALSNKGLLLKYSSRFRKNIFTSEKDSVQVLYQKWIEQKEELASLLANTSDDSKELENLDNSINILEKQLLEQSTSFKQNQTRNLNKWQDIQKVLKKDEVAIEMLRFRLFDNAFTDSVYYMALIISPEAKYPAYVILENGRELESEILNYYRNSTHFRKKDKISYKNFWKKIDNKIKNKKRIYFSPEGVYNEINLATLQNNNTYVFDYQDIWYLSSTEDVLSKSVENEPKEQKAMLFGNPTYYTKQKGSKVATLKGTEKEVKRIANMLKNKNIASEVFTESQANEKAIKNAKNPSILHIATHGFFETNTPEEDNFSLKKSSQNPLLKAGLFLEGAGDLMESDKLDYHTKEGILTAYEVVDLPLNQTDLVILSACETGLGKNQVGEGVYGLQRAFLVAGAKTVVFSLFKVDDEVTANLMINFYQQWIKTKDKRVAFKEAQKIIKKKYKNPLYWGAFNMIGLN
ncbi:MAG: CHAT domain-containing tetratricopeptide repeat protein [Thermonemataceae bacterium]|nr:CHAT domain-containing tetratricopeptide repeat protein [Thermonemataceae bacterium]